MLGTMRRNTKIILWVTVIAFVGLIFLGWGMDFRLGGGPGAGIIARINGEPVNAVEYQRGVQAAYENFRRQSDRELTEADRFTLTQQAWQQMVEQVLIAQQVKKWKLRATDDEVLFMLRRTPPPVVTQNPAFQTNGQFDSEKYKKALEDPQLDWRPIEDYVRAVLPAQILQGMVISTAKVSEAEAREYFRNTEEKVAISYILFEALPLSAAEETVTDGDLDKYYREHVKEYSVGDEANLGFVKIDKAPSREDEAEVRRKMDSILEELKAGTDFSQLAENYSELPSARSGGDTGFTTKEGLTPELVKAIEGLKPGQVTQVVRDRRGFRLARLEETKVEGGKEKIRLREIVLLVQSGEETLTRAKDLAWEAHNQKKGGLKKFAGSKGLTFETTGNFEQGKFVPKLLLREEAPQFAFDKDVSIGASSRPFERADSWYVLELLSRTKPRVKPLSEVKEDVRRAIVNERRKLASEKRSFEISKKIQGGMSLEAAANGAGVQVLRTGSFNRSGFADGAFVQPELAASAFALDRGAVSIPVMTDRGTYIFRVDYQVPVDEQAFASQKDKIKGDLLAGKQREVYGRWLEELRKSSKIKDYRLEAERPGKIFDFFN